MAYGVVLVDDHEVLRDAIKEILLRDGEFNVLGEASNGADAVQVCRKLEPTLVVMDIGLPGINGIEATAELARHCPATRVLILSMYDDQDSVMAAVRAGAKGFVLKKACATELVDAMRAVARGGTYLGPQVSDMLLSGVQRGRMSPASHATKDSLSPREMQVLRLTVQGKANKEVATLLNLEVHTVRSYRKTMMAKLGVSNVAELIQVAVANGLVDSSVARVDPTR